MKIKTLSIFIGLLLGVSSSAYAVHEPRDESAGEAPAYTVQCPDGAASASACKVDKGTYKGWLTFKVVCQVCHGGGGMGSTFAPNLQTRFNENGVDFPRFAYVLHHGYTGEVGAMPNWSKNPRVMKNVDNLYRYLKARADNKLPLGRPKKLN